MTAIEDTPGQIVQTWKDGLRILWTYVPEMPPLDVQRALPWLTVVRWEYDCSGNEGMPGADENQHMLLLEAALAKVEGKALCKEYYRRIGAGLREIVFYIADRDAFLHALNLCAADDPRYPITINFYRDAAWSELQDLINDFNAAEPAPSH